MRAEGSPSPPCQHTGFFSSRSSILPGEEKQSVSRTAIDQVACDPDPAIMQHHVSVRHGLIPRPWARSLFGNLDRCLRNTSNACSVPRIMFNI